MRSFIISLMIVFIAFSLLSNEAGFSSLNLNQIDCHKMGGLQGNDAIISDNTNLGTISEAKAMVNSAYDYLLKNGKEKAYRLFMNKNSRFFCKDLYIFVIDMNGKVIIHGAEKEMIGKKQLKLKDSTGKHFVKDFISLMKHKNNGWVKYHWRNYETQEIEQKISFLIRIDDNTFMGCGAYVNN